MKPADNGLDKNHKSPQDMNRLIRLKEVLQLVPVSSSTWWLWVAQGKAPTPVRFGARCTCWKYSDVISFVNKEA